MTRSGSSKSVDANHGASRLVIARGFLKSAEDQIAVAGSGTLGNPIVATIVNAAIAYTDALTATFANKVNQQDHAAAVKTLRSAIGNRFPKAQETRLVRLLGIKDQAQYGARILLLNDAELLLSQLKEYAKWVEAEMAR
ncbi:hypothetical protein BLJAPNOD_04669 [Ensifer sp. M14]|uniref:hypothetical protein n=1 Tax=Ensifer sp. M14 TaxID=2203782 RepID=UPI000E1DEFCF|nr:hypothetical protein [Ensifer sp. M14]RDL48394.1 hypothetical protein BLJAPNOD_04669 [Ensifer sp. M14]